MTSHQRRRASTPREWRRRAIALTLCLALGLSVGFSVGLDLCSPAHAAAPSVRITTASHHLQVQVGQRLHLSVEPDGVAAGSDGVAAGATGVSWSSSGPRVATATAATSDDGATVGGVSEGVATVTAERRNDEGVGRDSVTVSVTDAHFTPIRTAFLNAASPRLLDAAAGASIDSGTPTVPAGTPVQLLAMSRTFYWAQATVNGTTARFWVPQVAVRIPATKITIASELKILFKGEQLMLAAIEQPVQANEPIIWTSSKNSVVRVTRDGASAVIRGTGKGHATITARAGSATAKLRVGVILDSDGIYVFTRQPKPRLKAVATGPRRIDVTWNPVPEATGYLISFEMFGIFWLDADDRLPDWKTHLRIADLVPGETYRVRLVAFHEKKRIKTLTTGKIHTPRR